MGGEGGRRPSGQRGDEGDLFPGESSRGSVGEASPPAGKPGVTVALFEVFVDLRLESDLGTRQQVHR